MSEKINGASGVEQTYSVQQTKSAEAPKGIDTVPMVDSENTSDTPEAKAKAVLVEDIKKGNALYNETNIIGDFMGLIFDKKAGNYVTIEGFPEGTTLGEVRKKYNLPPGSLRHLVPAGGGNFDSYKVPSGSNGGYVYIYDDNLADGIGVSTRELKGMFPDKQFSPWYKAGTKE